MTITLTDNIDALLADPTLSDAEVRQALTEASDRIATAAMDLVSPIQHSQRQELFPAFQAVFGHTDKAARKAFTRLVLARSADEPVSWADDWNGTITAREANRVLAALRSLGAPQ